MTPLRQRMLDDRQLRNLCPETQRNYVYHIFGLARFYQTSPESLSLEEIREYQLYLINERRLSPESVNQFVAAAKFLYNVTLETPWPEGAIPRARVPHRLPVVLSAVEVSEFFQHVCTIRYRAALMTAYGAGLRAACSSGWNKAKGRRIVTPYFRRACWKCCGHGGDPPILRAGPGTARRQIGYFQAFGRAVI